MDSTIYPPGEWNFKINVEEESLFVYIKSNNDIICNLLGDITNYPRVTALARLICQSKELLQIAEMFHDHMKGTEMEKSIPFQATVNTLNKINDHDN